MKNIKQLLLNESLVKLKYIESYLFYLLADGLSEMEGL